MPMPEETAGEAWILSDRDDHASRVSNGPLKGQTIQQLMERFQDELMGKMSSWFQRFPLLLKFLDAREMLSVQVHPSTGETAKTGAWVVLEAGAESRIYAGLKTGTTEENLRTAVTADNVETRLVSFHPRCGDGVFIPAGTVHSLGGDMVVFEVQQNSDVTFRLYDWKHVEARTGHPRPLQVEQALACIDYEQGEPGPVVPVVESITPEKRETLFHCQAFSVWRLQSSASFLVGVAGMPRVVVCMEGGGELEYAGLKYAMAKGDVVLLPASVGACKFQPIDLVSVLEIALPGGPIA
jgi:mannose-6-phosphate isomerase